MQPKYDLNNTGAEVQAAITAANTTLPAQINSKADKSNVLEKNNTSPFTPINDYNPATKKYVDTRVVNPGNSIELIAVSDTAPTDFEIGDKYYNTTDNLVYTAIEGNIWNAGEAPVLDVIYINTLDDSLYYYDGDALVALTAGGSGTYIGSDEPVDDNTNLWIDTDKPLPGPLAADILPIGSIVDYDGTTVPTGYEEITDEIILYENATGTNISFSISDNISNYKYIDAYITQDGGNTRPCVFRYFVINNSIQYAPIFMGLTTSDHNNLTCRTCVFSISGTSVTVTNNYQLTFTTSVASAANGISFKKIIGYK